MARLVMDVCWRVTVSELDSIREEGTVEVTLTLERSMNEADVELISGTAVTSSHRDILIFEDLTIKKGDSSPPCNSRRVNLVVEFLISLETLDTIILHSVCSTRQKNISIILFSIGSFDPLWNEIIYPS